MSFNVSISSSLVVIFIRVEFAFKFVPAIIRQTEIANQISVNRRKILLFLFQRFLSERKQIYNLFNSLSVNPVRFDVSSFVNDSKKINEGRSCLTLLEKVAILLIENYSEK